MALTRKEFDVLSTLATSPDDARAQAASPELDELRSMGLVSGTAITELGRKALEPYRVENAVIMAAGLSSRFVPVSYWRPKGLTSVRGEVLIERQIRQLHEAGVTDITVVVGYRADEFAYLAEKYGVRLVTNDLYAERNNNWTLWLVRDQLRNTYVCSSDDYFAQNPFETYVYRAYYSAVYMDGPTDEWCLGVDENDRITSVTVGGKDAWAMLGHVYFDRAFSNTFVRILESIVRSPFYEEKYADELWETIFARNPDCLSMDMRRYPADQVLEVDSVDELMEFDPSFLAKVECPALDNIAAPRLLPHQERPYQPYLPLCRGGGGIRLSPSRCGHREVHQPRCREGRRHRCPRAGHRPHLRLRGRREGLEDLALCAQCKERGSARLERGCSRHAACPHLPRVWCAH